jgi:hypothetical protein
MWMLTPYLIAFALLLVLAPLLGWLGRQFGSKAKGGVMFASILLGFGHVLDQPAKHAIEATEEERAGPENGDPPRPKWRLGRRT